LQHLKSGHGYSLPDGHSRFLFKLCDDGYFRLQTKRRENLKEAAVAIAKKTEDEEDMDVSYEITEENSSDAAIVSFTISKIQVAKKPRLTASTPQPTVKTKDISEFAVVKNYNK
jgi:hypothetical protein